MGSAYLLEQVQAVLKVAEWSFRMKNFSQAQKSFDKAVALLRQEGALRDEKLDAVLAEYAATFRRLGRSREAQKLEAFAAGVREALPGVFDSGGSIVDWWKHPDFVATLPALPVEFKASRGQWHAPSPAWMGFFVALLAIMPMALVPRTLAARYEGAMGIVIFIMLVAAPIVANRRRARWNARMQRDSWCRLDEEGVEYHDAQRHHRLAWAEIDEVVSDSVAALDDDERYDAVTVVSRGRRFTLSEQFFADREVKWVEGICRRKVEARKGSHPL